MRVFFLLLTIMYGFSAPAFADRLGISYFCYCKDAGKGFEPHQARVIYTIWENGVHTGHHRVADGVFYQTGINEFEEP